MCLLCPTNAPERCFPKIHPDASAAIAACSSALGSSIARSGSPFAPLLRTGPARERGVSHDVGWRQGCALPEDLHCPTCGRLLGGWLQLQERPQSQGDIHGLRQCSWLGERPSIRPPKWRLLAKDTIALGCRCLLGAEILLQHSCSFFRYVALDASPQGGQQRLNCAERQIPIEQVQQDNVPNDSFRIRRLGRQVAGSRSPTFFWNAVLAKTAVGRPWATPARS